jgi:outer membrane receptor protein involved in Fe transport
MSRLSDGKIGGKIDSRRIDTLPLRRTALCIALAIATPAFAQDAGNPSNAGLEEVIVTGSRILRRDASSDSPLLTVTNETLTNTSAISIDQQLGKLPQFSPGSNQFTDSGSTQATPTDSPGIATANLRDLGANRTLVLVDGRRRQPANASLAVDLNTIPTLAIDNVEIITGGAGSTYGADAVAGVVNFRLKRDFEGFGFDARYGATQEGDGEEYKVSALLGTNFADDRGNVMLGLGYAQRKPAFDKNHAFFTSAWTDPDTTGGSQPRFPAYAGGGVTQAAVDAAFPGQPAGDVSRRTTAFYFLPGATTADATIFVPSPGSISGDPAVGYTGPLYPEYKIARNGSLQSNTTEGYLSLPLEDYSAFLAGHYDITDHVEFYVQGNLDHKELTTQPGSYVIAFNQWTVNVPRDGQHPVPDSLATLLDSRTTSIDGFGNPVPGTGPMSPWVFQQSADRLGLPLTALHNKTNTFELLTGFRGDLGVKDWTYDVFISHGLTNQQARYDGYIDWQNYQELINQPNYGANSEFSNGRLGRQATCTSGINPFIDQSVSQDCVNILSPDINTGTDITQDQAELNIQGAVANLPAGELRFALGADWRRNKFDYTPDKGISTSNIVSYTLGLFDTTETHGSVGVKEIYGELLIPVLTDKPIVQSFELNAGVRYSDYDNIGGVTTWKTTGDWTVNDYLKFRGGYQVANRAPNVAELFQPPVFSVVGWPDHDPCSNITRASYGNVASNPDRAQVQALCTALNGGNTVIDDNYVGNLPFYFPAGRDLTQGNPDLDSEEAETWTFGTIINSWFDADWLREASVSLDYYRIRIDGAISPASTQVVYQECFNGLGNNPTYDPNFDYCQRILRQPNGFWVATIAQFENLGKIETSGVDATFNWGIDGPGGTGGRFFANVLFNYLDRYEIQNNPGGPIFDYADSVGRYRWKSNTSFGYSFGPAATLTLNWRHLPSAHNSAKVTNPEAEQLDTKSFDVFDLTGRWNINETYTLRAGIENLFDRDPNLVGVLPGVNAARGSTASDYDELGRRFFLGIGVEF